MLLDCLFARPMFVKGGEDELCRVRGVTARVVDCHQKIQTCMELSSCIEFGSASWGSRKGARNQLHSV